MPSNEEEWDAVIGYRTPNPDHPAGRKFWRFKTGESAQPRTSYFPDFNEWLVYGVLMGYCTVPVCDVHDALPLTEKESEQLDEQHVLDFCIPAVRLFPIGAGECGRD